jgi:hypothetical protein
MNTQIANKIELVRNSFPSVFSKDDVIRLLEDLSNETASELEQDSAPSIYKVLSSEHIKELTEYIYESLDSSGKDIIDDYELSLDGREIVIDSVYLNRNEIMACIECGVIDFKDNLEEVMETSN